MEFQVGLIIILTSDGHIANRTGKQDVRRVNRRVLAQRSLAGKGFAAGRTREGLLASMQPDMVLEVLLSRDGLAADVARILIFASVNA